MASVNGINSNNYGINSLLSTDSVSSGSILSDYSMIKNGSYKKLLKKYYQDQTEENKGTDTKETLNLSNANQNAKSLKDAVDNLSKIEVTEENRDKLKDATKKVVEEYNKLIDSGSEVDNKKVLRNTLWMTKSTQSNAGLLEQIGIKIGDGNKLEFDESKFDKSMLTTIGTITSGTNSFIDKLGTRANSISKAAVSAVSEKNPKAYDKTGNEVNTITTGLIVDNLK